MLKKFALISALLLFNFCSCRDYLTDVIDVTPPEITTDKSNYPAIDTVIVTLSNRSYSDIFVTGTYNNIEKQNISEWDTYSINSCIGGCPEFKVPAHGSITARVTPLGTAGIFRFVCFYSKKPGIPHEQKNIVYSNEFHVGE